MRARILRRFDALETEIASTLEKHIEFRDDGSVSIKSGNSARIYKPSITASKFHSDNSFVRLVMGPYGSGKTTMSLIEIIKRTCEMPVCHDGIRRARWCIVRNTSGELVSTSFKSWVDWFYDLGDMSKRQKPYLTVNHTFNDGNGRIELEVMFLALDRPDDIRKLKSLELTGCYLNELCEIPKEALDHMQGRVNRYPSSSMCVDKYESFIIADTNPPDIDHWIVKLFDESDNDDFKIFKQPPGLLKGGDGIYKTNHDAENLEHLQNKRYYELLASGKSEEFIKVFCLGEYGVVRAGKVVYPEFNSDLHAVNKLQALDGLPIYLGWDFGLTPACVVVQMTRNGQLLVLKEYCSSDMGIRSFAESIVIPSLKIDFPGFKLGGSYADPSGTARSSIFEEMSCIGELSNIGIETYPASTNDTMPRWSAVRYFLNRMTDGKPSFLISSRECPALYKGFVKDYYFQQKRISGDDQYHEKAFKNYCSHPHDALQYVCLELASTNIYDKKSGKEDYESFYNPIPNLL